MAFNADTLVPVAGVQPVRFFTYTTSDSRATVTGAGYFARAAFLDITVGSRITVTNSGDVYDVIITGFSATTGGATAAVAEKYNSAAVVVSAGGKLVAENGQGSATAGAVTLNKMGGVITTESLTTAAAADYTLTITNSAVDGANALCFASLRSDGSNSAGTPRIKSITPSAGSLVIVVNNQHASAAFNGTLKIAFLVMASA